MAQSRSAALGESTAACPAEMPIFHGGRRSFGIETLAIQGRRTSVTRRDLLALPFAILAELNAELSGKPPVLVVPPLAGGFPILLRDVVVGLLRRGPVAVIDWLDTRFVPGPLPRFGLDENVAHVLAMLRVFGRDASLVGFCQGALPALVATALISAEDPEAAPRSLVLVGSPIDPLANPTHVVGLTRGRSLSWFEDNVIATVPSGYPGAGRRVYPASAQLATLSGYLSRHAAMGGDVFWKLALDDGEDPVRFPFLSLCLDLMDLTSDFFLQSVQHVFHERSLPRGRLEVLGHLVDCRKIRRTRLMTVEGECDDIAAPGQTRAAHDLCSAIPESRRKHLLVEGCGHFSLFHGRTWRERILPEIAAFIDASAPRGVRKP